MECKISSLRAQSSYSNSVPRIIHILLYLENYNYCASPSWLGPAPTRSALTSQAETGGKTKILRCPTEQAQASLLSFIPNQLPSRQVQFLSYALARLFDKTMQKRRKGRDTSLTWCNFFNLWRTCSKKSS